MATSERDRESINYDGTLFFFGVVCKETGDHVMSFSGDRMVFSSRTVELGTEDVEIVEPKFSFNQFRRTVSDPTLYTSRLPPEAMRVLYRHVRVSDWHLLLLTGYRCTLRPRLW